MIRDWKLGFQILRYSFKYKQSLAFSAVFLVLGIIMLFLDLPLAGLLLLFPAVYTGQMLYTLEASSLVRSSYYQKKFQTSLPAAITLLLNICMYTALWVAAAVVRWTTGETDTIYNSILVFLAFSLILNCYCALAYKLFLISLSIFSALYLTLLFVYALVPIYGIPKIASYILSTPLLLPMGYVLLLVGAGLRYGLSLLVYRRDFSKAAFFNMSKAAR